MDSLKSQYPLFAKSIIDNIPMSVYRVDIEGKITFANQTLLKQLQLPLEDVLGKTAYDFYPVELAQKYRADDQHILETLEPFHEVEQNRNPATGKLQWVEVLKTPLRDNGKAVGIQGVFWDVSERYLLEKERQRNQALLQTLAQHSPDYVMMLNEHLCICYINHPLPGLTEAQLRGLYLPELTADTQKNTARKLLETLVHGGQCEWQTHYNTPSGRRYHLTMRAVKIDAGEDLPRIHLTATDISDRIESDRKLRLAATVYTATHEAILITDAEGMIIDSNQAFTEISGYMPAECCGAHFSMYLFGENDAHRAIETHVKEHHYWQGELNVANKQQTELIVLTSVNAVLNEQNLIQNFVILLQDITRQKQHQRQLEYIALFDALTNLPNRYALNEELETAMQDALHYQQRLAVLYLDLDGFKAVNDRHGRSTGDKLLAKIAHRLLRTVAPGDTLARIGGDEFVILAQDFNSRSNIELYYAQILEAVFQPISSDVGVLELSGNLGITFFPQNRINKPEQLLRQADLAMHEAKLKGKNSYAIFNCLNEEPVQDITQDIAELRQALDRNEFVLYYQPKVNMRMGRMIGAEALLRWQHSLKGLLTPESFLPPVIDAQIAVEIDQWVLNTALTQLHAWQTQNAGMQLSININVKTLEQQGFANYMRDLLDTIAIAPNSVTLEIQESSAVEDVQGVTKAIHSCMAIGIQFSIDHFGTGFSTLKILNALPAKELKIDRSIVRDMLEDDDDMAIIQGVQGLAAAFNKSLVAEGVETEAHGFALLNIGCEMGQGYAIAKPMQASKLMQWNQNWAPCPSWLM